MYHASRSSEKLENINAYTYVYFAIMFDDDIQTMELEYIHEA